METRIKQFLGLLFMFIAALSITAYAYQMDDVRDTVSLEGHVYSQLTPTSVTAPVANAEVSLYSFERFESPLKYTTTTDSNGAFKFSGVLSGDYTLMITATGYAALVIRDFEAEHNTDSLRFVLKDSTKLSGGIVKGHVDFHDSNIAVTHAIIEFINTDNTKSNFFAITDIKGDFIEKVPAGNYYISATVFTADSGYFYQEFYDDAQTIANAKVVSVANGQIITDINFEIPSNVYKSYHSVSFEGKVMSDSSTAVANATVKIWAVGKCRFLRHRTIFKTQTDAQGNFSIKLDSLAPSLNTFVVAAYKEGYHIQFFNSKRTFYRADLLMAYSDTLFSNINFNLTPIDTEHAYTISGMVTDTANVGIGNAFVMAFDSVTGKVRLAVTDDNGSYTLKGLASGSYYMMFFANGYNAIFYPNAIKWEDAGTINVASNVTGINAVLTDSYSDFHSGGEIIGIVHSEDGTPLSGALVTVKTSAGVVIGTDITGDDGSYDINGLVQGNLTVTASINQYQSQQTSSSYNPNSESTDVQDFTMPAKATSITSKPVDNVPNKFALYNNYPNPFNPSTTIKFSIPHASHVTLDIYNIVGQKVAQLVNENMTAGNYNVEFKADNLSSGIYLYRLQTDGFSSTKKMILMK
jgi:Carboxypeptidase regulatory-like domain/Secretion system C-terminal sorting domain